VFAADGTTREYNRGVTVKETTRGSDQKGGGGACLKTRKKTRKPTAQDQVRASQWGRECAGEANRRDTAPRRCEKVKWPISKKYRGERGEN